MKFKEQYLIGLAIGTIILVADFFYFFKTRWFFAIVILSINIMWLQFWMDFFKELNRQKEIEAKFLEFVRNLVSTVKSGIPIPQAIRQVADKEYGALTPYVRKLGNQAGWGIPIHEALVTFSKDTNNAVIKRSVSIVIEAERSGGDIENVLDSVTEAVVNVKRMKQERKASTFPQIVQGYIVYFVFIGIMLVLQLWLFPQLTKANIGADLGAAGFGIAEVGAGGTVDIDKIFFSLIVIQGLFSGIMIGKFSEASIKQGLLQSLILITSATMLVTLVKGGI